MPRKTVELSDVYPYHICARSNNRDWFDVSLDKVFGIYSNIMELTISRYNIECHAFVLMANHFHMLISTPNANLSKAMRFFMTETSRAIARSSKRINRIYGARYHWTIIKSAEHYAHAYYYVYRNPIKHNAVQNLLDYPWSTLLPFHKKFNSLITDKQSGYGSYIPKNKQSLCAWLQTLNDNAYNTSVEQALKKHVFKFSQDRLTGKKSTFLDALHPKHTPST